MKAGADLVRAFDLAGTAAFALSSAIVGMRRGMDLFRFLLLAFVTAIAGGVLRDLLVGNVPPRLAFVSCSPRKDFLPAVVKSEDEDQRRGA